MALRGLRPGQTVRYVAADISTDMLARARARAAALGRDDIEFVETDIERMPFDDNEFDVCVSYNGLHCLPDPAAAIREMSRCLKPGGRLIGDSVVRGAGMRQNLAFAVLHRAGVFGAGGTVDELAWLAYRCAPESRPPRMLRCVGAFHRDGHMSTFQTHFVDGQLRRPDSAFPTTRSWPWIAEGT